MAYPYTLTYGTVSAGDAILAAHHNTTHQEHIDSNIPENIDDYSVSAAEMRTTADPYPGSTESLATTLAGEIERLRYVLKQITGGTYWYTDPVGLDSTIVSSSLTSVGTIGTGVWQGTSIGTSYTDAKVTSVSGSTGAVVDGDIDHDALANFASNEHYTQANITATGTVASGVWNGTSIGTAYTDAKVTSVSGSTGAVTDGDIDHDSLANFASNEHYTQANITATGTVASGTWQGTAIDGTYIDLEGTEVKSTGEGGGTKYLREDGDGTCSWQAVAGGVTSVSGSTGVVADGDIDHDQLANFASNEHYTQANITATGTIASGTWNGTSISTTYTDAKLADVVDDTTPQLGGDLDLNSNNITGTGDIPAANLTGTLPAIDGSNLTGLSSGSAKNIIINGNFDIWQRGTSFAAMADGTYTADRWNYQKSGVMVHTISRDTDVPTVAESGMLSQYSIKIDCTTIDASIAASERCWLRYHVEGYDWSKIAQKAMTLSFWHKHTKTGTYCVGFRNNGGDRTYVTEYTQTTTDTWEKATINISASPSGGTWDYTNGIGLMLNWGLATGSTFHATGDVWNSSNDFGTSNQVNACDSTSNNFMIAQVQLEAGSVATDFEIRDYATELAMCKRYFERINADSIADNFLAVGMSTSTTTGITMLECEVEKRTTPTVSHSAPGDFDLLASAGSTKPVTALTYSIISKRTIRANGTVASGLIAGEGTLLQADGGGTGYIDISAEL